MACIVYDVVGLVPHQIYGTLRTDNSHMVKPGVRIALAYCGRLRGEDRTCQTMVAAAIFDTLPYRTYLLLCVPYPVLCRRQEKNT